MSGLGDVLEEYRKLAELHKWGGNPYLLASKVWKMRQALEKVLVDHRRYEEAVQEMMRKGKSWDEIARYIDGVVKEAESIRERHGAAVEIVPPSKSLEELKKKIETLEIPAPDVSLGVWGEGRDGVLEIFIKNRSPLPLAVEVGLEGATPLRPLKRARLRPHSSESWRVPVIVEGQRITVRITYRSLGVERGGTVERAAVLRPAGTPKYVNVPIPTLERLDKEEVMAIRHTTNISIGGWRPSAYLGEGGFYHAFLALKRGEEAVLKIPKALLKVERGPSAVKTIEVQQADSEEAKRYVQKEVEILQKVKRVKAETGIRHLVDFLEAGEATVWGATVPFIALRYYPKGNVGRAAGRLAPGEALLVAAQVGRALLACYERGVFSKHGDLKPENLLIDRDGVVAVTDFQTAKAPTARERRTQSPAPSTAMYAHRAEDDRADVYALGRILVDLTAGLNATEDKAPKQLQELIAAARSENPPYMHTFLKKAEDLLNDLMP
jgi:hypothetical protein